MIRRTRQAGAVREREPKIPAAERRLARPWNRIDEDEMQLFVCPSLRKLLKMPRKKPLDSRVTKP